MDPCDHRSRALFWNLIRLEAYSENQREDFRRKDKYMGFKINLANSKNAKKINDRLFNTSRYNSRLISLFNGKI